ncbi:MAG: phenylalanine--tRNA ligase subunit alpha [Clostridia bacterium]|nr:phenylalanine--tRNA ligase subunit alpha [Clostridia bacterium]
MKEKILRLKEKALEDIKNAKITKALADLKVKYLGKSGEVTELLKGMKDVPNEEKPAVGKLVNGLRSAIEEFIAEREKALKEAELKARLEAESIDVTLPGKATRRGGLHPVNLVRNELIEAFSGLGFKVFTGPEVELDYYNFQQLNIPADHPARDMQDTFYVTDSVLLRTQTSAGQIRCMENEKPPIKILSPGRVYRSDYDATHSPMFHQMEGLVVDKGITLCDLKGVLEEVCKKVFDKDVKTRLRPSYFPFTEPSVEIDVSCSECGGKGCSLCKGTGWIEILGAGMVNRVVLENCGVDPDVYTGFAFGLGLERIAMLKYGIPDIRYLFDNDIRFLKQF